MREDTATAKVPNTLAILFRSVLGWAVAALLGVAGIFAARVFGFPNLPAAQAITGAFGLAAITSDAVGEGLQTFLLPLIAWALAFGAVALIIGGAARHSVVHFLRAGRHGRRASARSRIDHRASSQGENGRYILALVLLCVPFYLNDFSSIYLTDWRLWISIDYTTVKLLPFLVVLWLIRSKKMEPSEFGLTAQPVVPFVTVFLIGALAGTFINENGYQILREFPGYPPLGGMPEIESTLWNCIDLTVGLLMVGIFEELVFRGYLHTFLTRYTQRPLIIIGISGVAFGFIHWSGGLHKVVVTSAVGAVFMLLYLRTRSLPAIMLAHFVVNFIGFAHVIPKYIVRFT